MTTEDFDLEKARLMTHHWKIDNPQNSDTDSILKDMVEQANLLEPALAEIERLRAKLAKQAARIEKLEADTKRIQKAMIKYEAAIRMSKYNPTIEIAEKKAIETLIKQFPDIPGWEEIQ